MSYLSVSASVDPGDTFHVSHRSPSEHIGQATVFVNLSPFLTVMFHDPAVLADLAAQVTGPAGPPMVAEPVGDTGLTLHPLPVGEA